MKAICVNNINQHNVKIELTINNVYDVKEYKHWYLYENDLGQKCAGSKDWFVSINKLRKDKLKKLNIKHKNWKN